MLNGSDQAHNSNQQEENSTRHDAANNWQAHPTDGLGISGHTNKDEPNNNVQDIEECQGAFRARESPTHFPQVNLVW